MSRLIAMNGEILGLLAEICTKLPTAYDQSAKLYSGGLSNLEGGCVYQLHGQEKTLNPFTFAQDSFLHPPKPSAATKLVSGISSDGAVRGLFFGLLFEAAGIVLVLAAWKLM